MMELSEEELSKLPLYGVNYQPNSFKRKESESKRVLYYNGFNKENKESEKYCEFTIFDDDTYKQPQRGNKNTKVKSVKLKKTFPKSRTKETVMDKEIPMADYLHTLRNVTQIIIIDPYSFPLSCEELIERRAALRQVFEGKVPHRMKIAIINKSDESSSKLEKWRTKLKDNNIEIIDHLQRSDYKFLLENFVELIGDFWRKGRKSDMLELLKLGGEINQVHEEEIPDREEISEIVALMGISVRGLMTEEEGANDDVDVHDIKGPPRQVEDVSPPKRREGANTSSEPALDMTSQKTYRHEEGTQDFGIIISDELGLKEDDDAENVVDITERNYVDSEDGVPSSLDTLSIAREMNFVQRLEGWCRKSYTPEAENSTARIREAHRAGVEECSVQEVNSRDLHLRKQIEAAPIHQTLLSKNFNLILHALVNYVRLHAMNAFIVPGSHLVRHPIWTSEVYVIIRIFENGEEIIRRLFKNKKRQHAEDVCLEALKDLMKDKNTDNWRIKMYVNYSPCHLCRPKIIEFIKENEIFFGLRFHSLFQMNRASCERNICNCPQFPNHDQNKKEFIDMKDNPYIDSIGIAAAAVRRELSEVLHLNLSEDILQNLNQLKRNDDIEMASYAEDLGILKSGRGWTETDNQEVGVDLVGGVSGRSVTEDGVNNNLAGQDGVYFGVMDNNIDQNSSLSVNWDPSISFVLRDLPRSSRAIT